YDLDAFIEALRGLDLRNAEALELGIPVALADAEIEAAAGEQVEGRDLLGEQHRVMPGQHHHGGAKPQALGAAGDEAQKIERRRNLAVAGEMMLDHEQALVAELLRMQNVVDELVVGLAVGAGFPARLGAAEQTESHRRLPSVEVSPFFARESGGHNRACASSAPGRDARAPAPAAH